jgi:hypothetical protein
MTCEACERAEAEGLVAYVRIDKANVGIIGCKEHVMIVLKALDEYRRIA